MAKFGDTPRHDAPSLCESCKFGRVVRGHGINDEIIECQKLYQQSARIRFKVTTCTVYADRTALSLYDMRELAWVVDTSEKRQAGFLSPAEFKKKFADRSSDWRRSQYETDADGSLLLRRLGQGDDD